MANYATSGAAFVKAGLNASTVIPESGWVAWASGATGFINVSTRFNWNDNFTTLDDDTKHILDDTASSLVAIQAISYDMSGYTTRGEAESMINIQRDNALRGISVLRDIKSQTFMGV